ncbi:MAG: pyridoxamine 5'-phosphate oxidase [Porticoccaceae bacterium]
MSIDAYRGPYFTSEPLHKKMLHKDPFEQFRHWYTEAEEKCSNYANPMSLATCGSDGQPIVRTVLLKGFDSEGFNFYTNYLSRKGRQLAENPQASVCFYWEELERQVIIIGQVSKMSEEESDDYYLTRPRGSQIGAHVSRQSQPIENRKILEDEAIRLEAEYFDKPLPRPENWGGYRLIPQSIEFWQGQPDRLHDRFIYEKNNGDWSISRYAP